MKNTKGWGSGLLGVMIFSGSLPATRLAVEAFSPLFLTSARAAIAAGLAAMLLLIWRQPMPRAADFVSLLIVAIGVVIGFPLLTAMALQHISAAHSIIFIGLLPLSTAIFGMVRGQERPRPAFWFFSATGSLLVAGYALSQSQTASLTGDLLMLAAIIICGLGYAEGGRLSRHLGGWQVISWALLMAAPFMAGLAALTWPESWQGIRLSAWLGFGYVSVFSMLIGFVFWYRGLALGGTVGVGQLQLLQPFMGLGLSALLLGEPIAFSMVAISALVMLCVLGAKRFGA